MPVYDYLCKACKKEHEIEHKMSEKRTKCPSCGKPKLEKQLQAAALKFVGSGFYVNDYRGK